MKLTGNLIVAILFLVSCTDNQRTVNSEKEKKTMENNKEIVRRLYEDCLNKRNYRLMDEFIAKDYVGIRGESGPSGFTETTQPIITAFPDIQWKVEDLIGEGDKVVIKWSTQGTHTGTFRGIFPPSNKQIEDRAIVIYQFKEGKIIKAWMQVDRLGFLQQLGIIPEDLTLLSSQKQGE